MRVRAAAQPGARRAARVAVPPAGGQQAHRRRAKGAQPPQDGRHRTRRYAVTHTLCDYELWKPEKSSCAMCARLVSRDYD